jgi:hypothetical protein
MRIAYILLAHKLPDQLVRLVRRLDTGDTTFVVHIDRKAPAWVCHAVYEELGGESNVRFLDRRRVVWSGFGHVRATLDAIELLEREEPEVDYALLLSGQDYPIKPPTEIASFLEEAEGKSFIEHFPLPWRHWEQEHGGFSRLEYPYVELGRRLVRVPIERRVPSWLTPYGGSAYWCLSRACLDEVSAFVANNSRFIRFFKTVKCPDEFVFQTILVNSPLRDTLVDHTLTFTDWNTGSSHPNILRKKDLVALAQSPALFARKFDAGVDGAVLDLIDEQLLLSTSHLRL